MKYTPRPATFHLKYLTWEDNLPKQNDETFANEADAHIRMAMIFKSRVKKVVFEKSTVYEVEK